MTKIRLLGAVVVVLTSLAPSVMARPILATPAQPARSIFCATREPGNPHSKYCDYIAWSKWRERGGWDSSLDNACIRDPGFVPGECGFDQQGQPLFGASVH